RRIAAFHRPYHAAVDQAIDRALGDRVSPMLVSIHSFTPAWRHSPRPWHCGVLWSGDRSTAEFCLAHLRAQKDLVVGDNQPYSGELENDSMDRHGTRRGISHVLIEVRQDLLTHQAGITEWTNRLGLMLLELVKSRSCNT